MSLTSDALQRLVIGAKDIPRTLGSEKKIQDKEAPVRSWAYRSVVSKVSISKGTFITEEMICTKRPGTGIPSRDYRLVIGRKSLRDIDINEMLSWKDVVDE